jgi:hypothetical protein
MLSGSLCAYFLFFREILSISDVHDGDSLELLYHLLGLSQSVIVRNYHHAVLESMGFNCPL